MSRSRIYVLLLGILLVAAPRPLSAGERAQDAPCFAQTGFCVADPAVGEFFEAHGAQDVLGYPISRLFWLRGERVQLFQRVAVRHLPGGGAETLGLLDEGLVSLKRLNGSLLPQSDEELIARAPRLDQPDYPQRAEAFLRNEVPDVFEGQAVGFQGAYGAAAAGSPDGILAALQVFGWPTSSPRRDPANPDLVYQRFERAIFQFDGTRGSTQPLLLGDYLKSIITGDGLPTELEDDARQSSLLHQYHPGAVDGFQRPWEMAGSNFRDAFRRDLGPGPRVLMPEGFGGGDWPSSSDESLQAGPYGNGYAVSIAEFGAAERGASAATSNQQHLSDFSVVVDARLEEDGSAGYALYLRQQPDGDRFALVVDAERRLACFYDRQEGYSRLLWDWTPIPALRETTEVNRLTVLAAGQRFAAWINGAPIFDLEADGPSSGTLWLAAVTWDRPSRAIFSGLHVTAPG